VEGLLSKTNEVDFMRYIDSFDLVCLTETHTTKAVLDISLFSSFHLYISDAKKLSHHGRMSGGVIVMVKKHLVVNVQLVKSEIDNTIVLNLGKSLFNSTKDVLLICAYLPPCDSKYWQSTHHGYGVELLDKCILDLSGEYEDFHLIICGDLNARTASDNHTYSSVDDDCFTQNETDFPRTSHDKEINLFGEDLLEFCSIHDCMILNGLNETDFDGSFTFVGNSGSSVVDYFIVSVELYNCKCVKLLEVESRVESDHMPVCLTVKQNNVNINTCKAERKQKDEYTNRLKWDTEKESIFVSKLKETEFMSNLEVVMLMLDEDVDKALDVFVTSLTTASECMVKRTVKKGVQERKGAVWFDSECIAAKKESKRKLRFFRKTKTAEDYLQARKRYKCLLKTKKRQHKRNLSNVLTENLNNSSVFWKELRNIGGGQKSQISTEITKDNWFNHFKNTFSLPADNKETENNMQNMYNKADILEDPEHDLNKCITENEVVCAINKLSKGKACGTDGILSEMLKTAGYVIVPFLCKLCNNIFDKGIYPKEWTKAIVIPIFKKGDNNDVDNYRGISLLSIISKCYTSILNLRLYNWLEDNNKICKEQSGFRKNHSTTDQIFTLYSVVQKCLNKQGQKLYVAFVDFKKAFDSVRHDVLLNAINTEGITGKFFISLMSMYNSLISCVRVNGDFSDFFDCPVGVRQGCILSPTLFSLVINTLAKHMNENGKHGVQLLPGLLELFILLFADDVALVSTTPSGLQNQLNVLKNCCDQLKLQVNEEKTKVMVFRKGGYLSKHEKWNFNGTVLEVVNKYCYLGFTFTTKLSTKLGTNHLVSKAKKALMYFLRIFQRCKDISKDVFFKIFDAKIQSILLYSCEIWGLQKLDSIERVHLLACKRFLNVPLKTPNKLIYGELGRYPLYINTFVRCVKFWFRLLLLEHDRLPWQAYQMLLLMDTNGKRCWATCIREILSSTGFYFVWLNQGVGDIAKFIMVFRQRLIDIYRQEWWGSIRNKERYFVYNLFKTAFQSERYLSTIDIYCFRVAFSQVRLNALPINANIHRYSENIALKYCVFCKDVIENEHHMIYVCPLYSDLRNRFIEQYVKYSISHLLNGVNTKTAFDVGKFVFYAIRKRVDYMDN